MKLLRIEDFQKEHIPAVEAIVLQNYREELQMQKFLPTVVSCPELEGFVSNGLGVVAFDDDKLVGFLSCYKPNPRAFRSTTAIGVYSPLEANGAIGLHRDKIYARLYEVAARKWLKVGATNHTITLYAHAQQALQQMYKYGFGLRLIDAMRDVSALGLTSEANPSYKYEELEIDNYELLLPLNKSLVEHLAASPTFMRNPEIDEKAILVELKKGGARYFVIRKADEIIAYLKVTTHGENFICENTQTASIFGAYCLPEHRGNDNFAHLLDQVISQMSKEGYQRVGVDFESFNPTALNFWLKYFSAYTNSVVRRIDEQVIAYL